MSRIGIMGGTFNPIHNGHLHIAKAAYTQYHLNYIYFMPNHIPAYKSRAEMIRVEDRVEMVKLAISEYPYFTLNTMEIDRGGKTYTADTLRILHQQGSTDSYFFIIGADSLETFPRWYHPQEIISYAQILVAARKSADDAVLNAMISNMEETLQKAGCFHILHCPREHTAENTAWISSSQIRRCISMGLMYEPVSGEAIENILPKSVYAYIKEHQLYA